MIYLFLNVKIIYPFFKKDSKFKKLTNCPFHQKVENNVHRQTAARRNARCARVCFDRIVEKRKSHISRRRKAFPLIWWVLGGTKARKMRRWRRGGDDLEGVTWARSMNEKTQTAAGYWASMWCRAWSWDVAHAIVSSEWRSFCVVVVGRDEGGVRCKAKLPSEYWNGSLKKHAMILVYYYCLRTRVPHYIVLPSWRRRFCCKDWGGGYTDPSFHTLCTGELETTLFRKTTNIHKISAVPSPQSQSAITPHVCPLPSQPQPPVIAAAFRCMTSPSKTITILVFHNITYRTYSIQLVFVFVCHWTEVLCSPKSLIRSITIIMILHINSHSVQW